MKLARPYPVAKVTKKAQAALHAGHPWVYDAEITGVFGDCANGDLIDVQNEKGAYLGTGLISEHSKIRIRVLSANANDRYDAAFFKRRLEYALSYRKTVLAEDELNCCRLVFGEADGLPGLTVDRYDSLLSVQIASYGMEQRKADIYRALAELLPGISGIYERNDIALRELEGLPRSKGWYEGLSHPDSPLAEICENGIFYTVDVENGQKTGFFLDQKYNRRAAAVIARNKRVLDCFTHTGSFALNAAKAGAIHVTAVDVSQTAVGMARANAEKNGLADDMDFVCADVFDLLPQLVESHAAYDMIILDPPAFTKSRKTVAGAERGYKEINYRAMKLLPRGGYLATCSCSHFMSGEAFIAMLGSAARDADVQLKLIESRRQSPDHPTLLSVPETDYLKFYLFHVI